MQNLHFRIQKNPRKHPIIFPKKTQQPEKQCIAKDFNIWLPSRNNQSYLLFELILPKLWQKYII